MKDAYNISLRARQQPRRQPNRPEITPPAKPDKPGTFPPEEPSIVPPEDPPTKVPRKPEITPVTEPPTKQPQRPEITPGHRVFSFVPFGPSVGLICPHYKTFLGRCFTMPCASNDPRFLSRAATTRRVV